MLTTKTIFKKSILASQKQHRYADRHNVHNVGQRGIISILFFYLLITIYIYISLLLCKGPPGVPGQPPAGQENLNALQRAIDSMEEKGMQEDPRYFFCF